MMLERPFNPPAWRDLDDLAGEPLEDEREDLLAEIGQLISHRREAA